MDKVKKLFALGMILALVFSMAEVEAKKRSYKRKAAPRCRGIVMNCSNNGDTMKCLACNASREALYSEGIEAMIRVNRVAIERSKSGQFPRNICSVIHQKHQFSWTSRPTSCISPAAWGQAKEAAKIALQRGGNGHLYFHANYVKPRWARFCVGDGRVKGDTHVYYSQCFGNATQLARYKRANPNANYANVDSHGSRSESGPRSYDTVDMQARSGN